MLVKDVCPKLTCINFLQQNVNIGDGFPSFSPLNHPFNTGSCCGMSTSRGRSMRSKVEKRMQRESSKTLREIRRAKKLKKKLMTDEERLIYNLKRAKKKVALLLQKLKKYELPPPVHDPVLFRPELLQASEIKIMFLLVVEESLGVLSKICIFIGSFMKLRNASSLEVS